MKQTTELGGSSLFAARPRFRVVQLDDLHAKSRSDDLFVLRELITQNEPMYPAIDSWFSSKVIPGLRSKERVAYVAYESDRPIAAAILKLGERAKFCHLRVDQDFRDLDLGQMFFTQMTLDACSHAKTVHFTLPESLWYSKKHFFGSFGFSSATKALRQYRNGEEELICSAAIDTVRSAALEKLPSLLTKFGIGRYSLDRNLLMSIKPRYAEMLMNGSKLVEIRRRFSNRWVGYKVLFYASDPACAIVGEATISSVVSGTPPEIWLRFQDKIGCSWNDFEKYTSSAAEISAVELTDISPYKSAVSLAQISEFFNQRVRPPQSYRRLRLDRDNSWSRAASLATLLYGGFGLLEEQPTAPTNALLEGNSESGTSPRETSIEQPPAAGSATEAFISAWRQAIRAGLLFTPRIKLPPSVYEGEEEDSTDDFALRVMYERPALDARRG